MNLESLNNLYKTILMAQDKDQKTLNVPPLRFTGFTDEWKNNKVGNLFEISVAGDIDKSSISHNQSEKYPYPIISNSLENEGIYGYTNKYKCEAGTITVTGRGTLGIAKSRDYKYYPIVRLLSLKPCDSIDYRFAQYALNLIHYFFEVTGVPQLTAPQLSSYDIRYPTLSEQQKIARFLSLIDERIATQNKIIEDLKKLKSAISRQIFENATFVRLGELCDVVMGQSPASSSYNTDGDGMPLIQGNLDIKDGETISRIYTNEPTKISLCNELILTVRAPVGIIAKNKMKVCIGRGVCALRNKSIIPTSYIYHALDYSESKWRSIEQGSTFTSVNGEDIKSFTIPLVDNVENTSTLLSRIGDLINNAVKIYSCLLNQKVYLLSKMFI